MIRHIVFDMGNVLLHFDPQLFIQRVGVSDETDVKLIQKELFRSLEWVQMDRGSLSEQEAFERVKPRLPERLHPALEELLLHWDRPILPVSGMADFVKDCKAAGYNVYLLSNASRRLHNYWEGIPGHEWFDGRFVSADYRLVKPQQAIYQKFCEVFSLKGEECLFIDDVPLNIEGAVTAGWQGIVFHDAADLRQKARALGVKISE
ncbi:MAG: HAD family phosphatase [Clostridiales bacterium]|nr:HAD family phosphatase [Clostridiales bacterium]